MKKLFILILATCYLHCCAEPTKVIQVEEINVTIPAKWAVAQQGTTEFLTTFAAVGKYSSIGIVVSRMELNTNYVKYDKTIALPEVVYKNITCSHEEKGIFIGEESIITPFFATFKGMPVEGKVIVFNKYNRTITISYSYMENSKQGKDDIQKVLSSIAFNSNIKKTNQTLDQRMEAYVAFFNKTCPIENQNGITIDSVEVKGNQLNFNCSIDFAPDLSPQEMIDVTSEMKEMILKHMVYVQNSLFYKWLNKGNIICHKYFTNEKRLLINFCIDIKDIKKMENQLIKPAV